MPNFPPGAGVGTLFLLIGLAMMTIMAVDQTGLHVPLWVAEAAAACFAFAGGSILAQAYGKEHLARAFGLGVVYGLAVPGLWIAFGSDGSGCSASVGIGFAGLGFDPGALSCRVVFGLGAIVTLAFAVAITWAVMRGRAVITGSQPQKTAIDD